MVNVTVHNSVQTMIGEGLEALAPSGEWIALFSEGNLANTVNSSLSPKEASQGCEATLVLRVV